MAGFILIDKQTDWTSHDVVSRMRKLTNIRKIGHAGTLDPFATGLLIVAIERAATKRIDEFHKYEKTYVTTMRFGATSDTRDKTGVITSSEIKKEISENDVKEVLSTFQGEQEQIPPMYSAKKVGGKKLYELARKGIEVERKPSVITIHDIRLLDFDGDTAEIEVTCSTGTYIRTLCHDIGQKLGVGAYCEELRRTSIGPYSVENAIWPESLEDIEKHLFLDIAAN
jgi:tRNA pseudouridine55 synthase